MDPMKQQQALTVTVPGLYLDFLPPQLRTAARDYFVYEFEFPSIAAGGSNTQTVTVANDSHFFLAAIAGVVVDPADEGSEITFPPLTLTIQDSSAGRMLQNRPVHWTTVVGTGQLPAYCPYPRIFEQRTNIGITVNNLDPTDAMLPRLSLIGFKVFPGLRQWAGLSA